MAERETLWHSLRRKHRKRKQRRALTKLTRLTEKYGLYEKERNGG